jgi:hypothetical protein
MQEGLGILLIVIAAVGILHFVSLRLLKTSEVKKRQLRYVFWYFYGAVFLISGIVNLLNAESLKLTALVQAGIGLTILILHLLGKIETHTR